MNGFLLVDKPKGWTSFDVVNYVRKMVANEVGKKPRNVKVGHTGTLDPAATGLLVLCIGTYTKKVPELIKLDKTYEVEMTLGKNSTTGDSEGTLTEVSDTQPSFEILQNTLDTFKGEIEQTPPAYSAIKINGKRAYDLARAGKEVKIEPRKVHIYSIEDMQYEYPLVHFKVHVGSGTYIRSLVEDVGRELGTGAYTTALRRTKIGSDSLEQAYAISEITPDLLQKILV